MRYKDYNYYESEDSIFADEYEEEDEKYEESDDEDFIDGDSLEPESYRSGHKKRAGYDD